MGWLKAGEREEQNGFKGGGWERRGLEVEVGGNRVGTRRRREDKNGVRGE